jgi:hypothetical protein
MPFGCYRGVGLADLPDDYVNWLHGLDNLREPLRSAIEREWRARFEPEPAHPTITPEIRVMAGELITAGYRALTKLHHPDHGGETRTQQLVNAAAEWLRAQTRAR